MDFKEPVYEHLPEADFINNQERVIVSKNGYYYIIYGPEAVGDDVWAVFEAKDERDCGMDDPPDFEFETYQELVDWFEFYGYHKDADENGEDGPLP